MPKQSLKGVSRNINKGEYFCCNVAEIQETLLPTEHNFSGTCERENQTTWLDFELP